MCLAANGFPSAEQRAVMGAKADMLSCSWDRGGGTHALPASPCWIFSVFFVGRVFFPSTLGIRVIFFFYLPASDV